MGNQCNQCQPITVCGREALRKGLGQNTRTILNTSKTQHKLNKQSDKQHNQSNKIIIPPKQPQKFLLSTQQKSVQDKNIKTTQYIQLTNGIIIQGQYKGDIRDGKFIIQWPDNSQLALNYKNNLPVGNVKFVCKNQGFYQGQTDTQIAVGKGKMTLIDGSSYQGDWKNDKPHGNGVHKLSDGSLYEGQFVHGSKSGKGKFTFSNGSIYTGNFLDGFFHGQGVLKHVDGRQYSGQWKNGSMNGKGIMIYDESTRYQGQFLDGVRQGKGVYYFGDGRYWQGSWQKNLQNGQGKYKNKNGQIQAGVWDMGQRIDSSQDGIQKFIQKQRKSRQIIKIQEQ